jgi:hypothetical protein
VDIEPCPEDVLMAHLCACLALVRPVGMAERDTTEWLDIASRQLSHLPRDLVEIGCNEARMTCTHHGQIVPAIVKTTQELWTMRRDRPNYDLLRVSYAKTPKEPVPELTQDDVDKMQPVIRDLGIAAGWLQRDADGNVTLTPNPRGEAA